MDSHKSQQISNRIWFISACNPDYFTLCGTNIFLVGAGKNKTMIDCGHPGNLQFQANLKNFLTEHDFTIEVWLYAINILSELWSVIRTLIT